MTIRGKWVRRALMVAMAGFFPAAALADVLVIKAVGPSARQYPPGRRLPDNATLNLKNGDVVTVLKDRGTRIFRGPGRVSVASAPTPGPRSGGVRIAAGAVRGGPPTGAPGQATNLWQYDVGTTGRACFQASQPLVLSRTDARKALRLVLTQAGGTRTTLHWPAGQQTLALAPDQLARTTRIEYRRPNSSRRKVVTLIEVKDDPSDRSALVLGLMKQGCSQQVDTFVRINEEMPE